MQISEKVLKPCPFCGKTGQIAPDEIGSGGQHVPPYHAGCLRGAGCGIAFTADDPDEAIAEWNRRALTSATPPDVAGLVERLEGPLPERQVGVGRHGDRIVDYDYPAISRLLTEAATALRLSAGGGWRPMESAPHGVNVLLAYWDEALGGWHMEAGMASWGWRRDGVSNMSAHGQATHWQPLPASPTVEAGR